MKFNNIQEMEFKINQTKLKAVMLPTTAGDNGELIIDIPRGMSFETPYILLTGNVMSSVPVDPPKSMLFKLQTVDKLAGKVTLVTTKVDRHPNTWAIVRTDSSTTSHEYTADELRLVVMYARELINLDDRLAEILTISTEDVLLIRSYYSAIGLSKKRSLVGDYTQFFRSIGNTTKKCETENVEYILPKVPLWSKKGYSVQQLVTDLVKSKAEILIDSSLVGRYKSIVYNKVYKQLPNSWLKCTHIVSNSTRANLSLGYVKTVNVEIPENKFNIPPGPKPYPSIRSLCLIKDGLLWHGQLGIRGLDNSTIEQLRKGGSIVGELGKGEYVIDLTQLPLVSGPMPTGGEISKLAVQIELTQIIINYIKHKFPNKSTSNIKNVEIEKIGDEDEFANAEEFLASLGIKDGKYSPGKTDPSVWSDGKRSVELVSISAKPIKIVHEIGGMARYVKSSLISEFERFDHLTKDSSHKGVVTYVLNSAKGKLDEKDLASWSEKLATLNEELKSCKLRLLCSRTNHFEGGDEISTSSRFKVDVSQEINVTVVWKYCS